MSAGTVARSVHLPYLINSSVPPVGAAGSLAPGGKGEASERRKTVQIIMAGFFFLSILSFLLPCAREGAQQDGRSGAGPGREQAGRGPCPQRGGATAGAVRPAVLKSRSPGPAARGRDGSAESRPAATREKTNPNTCTEPGSLPRGGGGLRGMFRFFFPL